MEGLGGTCGYREKRRADYQGYPTDHGEIEEHCSDKTSDDSAATQEIDRQSQGSERDDEAIELRAGAKLPLQEVLLVPDIDQCPSSRGQALSDKRTRLIGRCCAGKYACRDSCEADGE